MTISASFTVGGVSNPAAHTAAYSSTVSLALVSTTGAGTILWEVVACSKSGASLPSVTRAGTPNGATASFVLPSDPGDGLGRAYLVKCSVSDSRTTVVEYAVVGALNAAGLLPIVPGEENARDATHGWSQTVNQALASTATPVPTTLGTPVADIAALKAVGASDRVDNQSRAVGSPAQVWIYSSGTGAGFASDDLTVVRPTDVLLANNGRWYPASPSAVVPTIAALRLAVAGALSCIHVQSYSALGDGGGDVFDYDASDTTSVDNSGTVIVAGARRWKRRIAKGKYRKAHFGAKSDVVHLTSVSVGAGSTALTKSGGSAFTSADVGKVIVIHGGGVDHGGGAIDPHPTTIAAYVGANAVTLTAPVTTAVVARSANYGTDDTSAIQATLTAITTYLQGGNAHFDMMGTGGQSMITTTLSLGASPIGVTITSDKRSRDILNADLIWGGALHGRMLLVRAAHAGSIDGLGFNGNGLADYCVQFDHQLGDTVTEHWVLDKNFFTGARIASVLIGTRIADGVPPANAGDLQNIEIRNTYFLPSQVYGLAGPLACVLQRSPNAVGNVLICPQFVGNCDFYSPTYGLLVESGHMGVDHGCAVGINSYVFAASQDGTNIPGSFHVADVEVQSPYLCSMNTAGGAATEQRPCSMRDVYQGDIFGVGASHSAYVKSNGYGMMRFDNVHMDNHLFIDNATSLVSIEGLVFNSGKGIVGTGSGTEEGSYYTILTSKWKRRVGEILGNLTFDSASPWFIQQAKRTGTGANAGNAGEIIGQQGQDQTGGAANNNGGDITVYGGPAGTGGAGAAGTQGVVNIGGRVTNIGPAGDILAIAKATATYGAITAATALTTGLKIVASAGTQLIDLVTNTLYSSADTVHFRNTAQGADQLVVTTTGVTVCNVNAPNGTMQCEGATGVELKSNGTVRFKCDNTGIGFFNTAPVAQPTRVGLLTDATGGSGATTLVDVGAVPTQANINNNFASVLLKINALESVLHGNGLTT